jgi:hypothetical protein
MHASGQPAQSIFEYAMISTEDDLVMCRPYDIVPRRYHSIGLRSCRCGSFGSCMNKQIRWTTYEMSSLVIVSY